jgi:hypothetical protein
MEEYFGKGLSPFEVLIYIFYFASKMAKTTEKVFQRPGISRNGEEKVSLLFLNASLERAPLEIYKLMLF